jgi:hypothetical protein
MGAVSRIKVSPNFLTLITLSFLKTPYVSIVRNRAINTCGYQYIVVGQVPLVWTHNINQGKNDQEV